jgi:hypothetical protein
MTISLHLLERDLRLEHVRQDAVEEVVVGHQLLALAID